MNKLIALIFAIAVTTGYAAPNSVKGGPGTTNTPSAWTNVVKAVALERMRTENVLTNANASAVYFPGALTASNGVTMAGSIINYGGFIDFGGFISTIGYTGPALQSAGTTLRLQTVGGGSTNAAILLQNSSSNILFTGTMTGNGVNITNLANVNTNSLDAASLGVLTSRAGTNDSRSISLSGVVELGGTNSVSVATNLNFKIINPVDGTGLTGGRFGSGWLWGVLGGNPLEGLAAAAISFYTNIVSTGATNYFGGKTTFLNVNLVQTALAGGTNLVIGQAYTDTLTADRSIAFTGTPYEGATIPLQLNVTGPAHTLTYPSSLPYGGTGTAGTTNLLWAGTHVLKWQYLNGAWIFFGPGILNNLAAVVDPTGFDCATNGYSVGSKWVNYAGKTEWICLTNTMGSTYWTNTLTSTGGGTTYTNNSTGLAGVIVGSGIGTNYPATITTNNGVISGVLKGDGARGVTAAAFTDVQTLAPSIISTNGNTTAHTNTISLTSGTLRATTNIVNISTNFGTFALGTNATQASDSQLEIWNPQGVQVMNVSSNGTTTVSNAIARTYFAATNMFILASTNYVAANFTPVTGKMILVPSNQVIYGVSVTKTSIVVDLR